MRPVAARAQIMIAAVGTRPCGGSGRRGSRSHGTRSDAGLYAIRGDAAVAKEGGERGMETGGRGAGAGVLSAMVSSLSRRHPERACSKRRTVRSSRLSSAADEPHLSSVSLGEGPGKKAPWAVRPRLPGTQVVRAALNASTRVSQSLCHRLNGRMLREFARETQHGDTGSSTNRMQGVSSQGHRLVARAERCLDNRVAMPGNNDATADA